MRLKTSLINKIHALSVSNGRKIRKTSLASEKGLEKVLQEQWTVIERIELDIIIEQIRSLKAGIKKLDRAIAEESEKLKGYQNLVSISGIGSLSAGILREGSIKVEKSDVFPEYDLQIETGVGGKTEVKENRLSSSTIIRIAAGPDESGCIAQPNSIFGQPLVLQLCP